MKSTIKQKMIKGKNRIDNDKLLHGTSFLDISSGLWLILIHLLKAESLELRKQNRHTQKKLVFVL